MLVSCPSSAHSPQPMSDEIADDARLVRVDVDGREITFAIDPAANDPIAHTIAERLFPADTVNDLWRHLVRPGDTVVDVGANLGTYSLPAAAVGASVLAVEASPMHAVLIELAARSNGFGQVEVLNAVAGCEAGTARFNVLGPWGHVAAATEPTAIEVPAIALDEAVATRGVRVDLIKIDVEGSELDALAGMKQLLGADDAPPILIEANGHMLYQYGHSPGDLIAALETYGYHCYLIDNRRLAPVDAADLQPDCVADYLAFKASPERLEPWEIGEPLDRAEVIKRLLATCNAAEQPTRAYGERVLCSAPGWLWADEKVQKVVHAFRQESFGPFDRGIWRPAAAEDGRTVGDEDRAHGQEVPNDHVTVTTSVKGKKPLGRFRRRRV